MKKALLFFIFALTMLLSSCADAYLVETVYVPEYRYVYSQPYTRVIISGSRAPYYKYYRPYTYRRYPTVRYRHYVQPKGKVYIPQEKRKFGGRR